MTLLKSLDLNSSLQGKYPGDSKTWHKHGHDSHSQGDFIPVEKFQTWEKLFTVCWINDFFSHVKNRKKYVGNIKLFQREINTFCVASIISTNNFESKNLICKVEEMKVFYIKIFMRRVFIPTGIWWLREEKDLVYVIIFWKLNVRLILYFFL